MPVHRHKKDTTLPPIGSTPEQPDRTAEDGLLQLLYLLEQAYGVERLCCLSQFLLLQNRQDS